MRDDDEEVDERGRQPEREDRRADEPPAVRDRVPDAEAADGERDLLLRRGGEQRRDPERHETVVVEEPDREQDQRHREADRVRPRVGEGVELRRRVDEIHGREAGRGALVSEPLAGEPVHGEGARGDCEGLDDEQHQRARPDPPERSEQREERVDVDSEPHELVPVLGRVTRRKWP